MLVCGQEHPEAEEGCLHWTQLEVLKYALQVVPEPPLTPKATAVLIDAGLLKALETVLTRLFKSIDAEQVQRGEGTTATLTEILYVLRTLQDLGSPENGAWFTAGFVAFRRSSSNMDPTCFLCEHVTHWKGWLSSTPTASFFHVMRFHV